MPSWATGQLHNQLMIESASGGSLSLFRYRRGFQVLLRILQVVRRGPQAEDGIEEPWLAMLKRAVIVDEPEITIGLVFDLM